MTYVDLVHNVMKKKLKAFLKVIAQMLNVHIAENLLQEAIQTC